jgi:hypothetical protein
LNDGQIPNRRVVHAHESTGYSPEEGNGRVSDFPAEIPTVTIRNFCIAVAHLVAILAACQLRRSANTDETSTLVRVSRARATAMKKLRIVRLGFGTW